jgi:hypothetical protein
MLTHSLGTFQILKAAVANKSVITAPLEWHYTLQADRYAKVAGDLLLVRPRVMGSQASGLLETGTRASIRSNSRRPNGTPTSSKSRYRRTSRSTTCPQP